MAQKVTMTAADPAAPEDPLAEENSVPQEVLQLWIDVGQGIDKSQTVVWKNAVASLTSALERFSDSPLAREFVYKYMSAIIAILVEQQPSKIGQHERNCVQDSLFAAIDIIVLDLTSANMACRPGAPELWKTQDTLNHILNRKKAYYKGGKGNWNSSHLQGFPDVRLAMIDRFHQKDGLIQYWQYLQASQGTEEFPPVDYIITVLNAIADAVAPKPKKHPSSASSPERRLLISTSVKIVQQVMIFVERTTDEDLRKLSTDHIEALTTSLQKICDHIVGVERQETYNFYAFWRSLALKLIKSSSLPIKLFGWEQVGDLIEASSLHRPPPRAFEVYGAGCTFVNGRYKFHGEQTPDGYSRLGSDITYVRAIPIDAEDGAGKKLTLFRCTMRSQQKWWFLSEADEEQPGTDRDIDYYQHKSKEDEEAYPPPDGWLTCRSAGVEPPPKLNRIGALVPEGEERNTLEHLLARWAIENKIVEQVLGDTTIHREVVSRSGSLVHFLAMMCTLDKELDTAASGDGEEESTQSYSLKASDLVFAWKTCTRKADEAVSTQVYQILVSILPVCPPRITIPLLRAVQTTLSDSVAKPELLSEVAGFCSALATAYLVDNKSDTRLPEEAREEVLNLLWSVLTHPEADDLNCYDSLKRYVTFELGLDPRGKKYRERFLKSCTDSLAASAENESKAVDEVQALRTVKLTHFILEVCPQADLYELIQNDELALPNLLFGELTAYLRRRKKGISGFRRRASTSSLQAIPQINAANSDTEQHIESLAVRFGILRFAFGLSGLDSGTTMPVSDDSNSRLMSFDMLDQLWGLMDRPSDRESLMIFIADASRPGKVPHSGFVQTIQGPNEKNEIMLSAAFSEKVCQQVLLDLFCAPSFRYEDLGMGAYGSFQKLLVHFRGATNDDSMTPALDALWRIYLTVLSEEVSSVSMEDILSLYIDIEKGKSIGPSSAVNDPMVTSNSNESFGDRIFEFLNQSCADLSNGDEAEGELACVRCLRLLNSSIGQLESGRLSTSASTLHRLSRLPHGASVSEIFEALPHGLRGKGCCVRIGIIIKRPQSQSGAGETPRLPSTVKISLDIHPLETLGLIKQRVALACSCRTSSVRPIQITGRSQKRISNVESANLNLNTLPEDTVMDELGVIEGCEIIFVVSDHSTVSTSSPRPIAPQSTFRSIQNDLSWYFFSNGGHFSERLFDTIFRVLDVLPTRSQDNMMDSEGQSSDELSLDGHRLAWNLLLAMPTNTAIENLVRSCHASAAVADPMEVEGSGLWTNLLDASNFNRSVYVLQVVESLLRPAPEAFSVLVTHNNDQSRVSAIEEEALKFSNSFLESGGFKAVATFFSSPHGDKANKSEARRGNAVCLRILKGCLFGNTDMGVDVSESPRPGDGDSSQLLDTLSDPNALLESLTLMVVDDAGVSSSTVLDVLRFLRLLFRAEGAAGNFVNLSNNVAERFLTTVLWWSEGDKVRSNSSVSASSHVRRTARDLILETPGFSDSAFTWLVNSLRRLPVNSETSNEHVDVLEKLLVDQHASSNGKRPSEADRKELCSIICKKIAACPRPSGDMDVGDVSTGVLCDCLRLLRALVENGPGSPLREGTDFLLDTLKVPRWSTMTELQSPQQTPQKKGLMSFVSDTLKGRSKAEDEILLDLIGAVFDGLLSPSEKESHAICFDKDSRRRAFDVIGTAARTCKGGVGYLAIAKRADDLAARVSPHLRHRWNKGGDQETTVTRHSAKTSSKYSGLRNQGCTCYMNSFLQQLSMMSHLRTSLCSAPLPTALRSAASLLSKEGNDLVGKKLSLQWENGASYEATVESFDSKTGMHTIRYSTIPVATVNGPHPQVSPEDLEGLPPLLSEEFILLEGRPGKETGLFELVKEISEETMDNEDVNGKDQLRETEEEAASRHLLEEVQRTLIYLEEAKGRCYDPRALVEASACLKLEFDVWQQNDASEFATKLLDRLEITLKKWAPEYFERLDHTFGFKQTKQKLCKECGLKTNREEKLLNVDCQIRGKSHILEALDALTEEEIMEGSNKVFCDSCKKNTDTVLRTALSTLPNVLILSLKRFDLDFTTFETVKLNSRCAFDHNLNLKNYTLDGIEERETKADEEAMAVDDESSSEDYEYRLAGVLIHAGVAQGGHYYSFIRDRSPGADDQWYRFDDEDVTPFDPKMIEQECFGGKVKKETKWPNGQVHTVEQEQFANALMLFYEKVKPSPFPGAKPGTSDSIPPVPFTTGYEAYEPDVRKSNNAHRWQTFLFESEYRTFMQGLLGVCSLELKSTPEAGTWRPRMVQTLYTYLFDVLMYASDRSSLHEWTETLERILLADQASSIMLLRDLAKRSASPSSSWLRHFLLECPEDESRNSAVRIFCAAFRSAMTVDDEMKLLEAWTVAMSNQAKLVEESSKNPNASRVVPYPCGLETNSKELGKPGSVGNGASSIGVIFSELNRFLEDMPRRFRFRSEIGLLVRELSSMSRSGAYLYRSAMIEALIPCRIIALLGRNRIHNVYRFFFPGSTVPEDVAQTQIRAESSPGPSFHMGLTAQQLHSNEADNSRGPSQQDFLIFFEALAGLMGLPGTTQKDLLVPSNDSRGRPELTNDAVKALSIIFREHCPPGSPGLTERELEEYVRRCAIDPNAMPSQHVIEILSKYSKHPSQPGGPRYLELDGFVEYYRETAQTNEIRVRLDLHTFGFRPDLTRRSRESRIALVGSREAPRKPAESVAVDVSEWFSSRKPNLGRVAELGLKHGFSIFMLAHQPSEPLFEYLVAATAYHREAKELVHLSLRTIYISQNDWQGHDRIEAATCMLAVLASIPDSYQPERIDRIMVDAEPPAPNVSYGGGLLQVAKIFMNNQNSGDNYQWVIQRYSGVIRHLRGIFPVFQWLNENRDAWSFIENEVMAYRSHHYQSVSHGSDPHISLNQNTPAYSDMIQSDEDSHLDDDPEAPDEIFVQFAGNQAVDGAYYRNGMWSGACRYIKDGGMWKGQHVRFTIFQCNVSNNTKHWYISIIPDGKQPGTAEDIDFYSAPVTNATSRLPPRSGWVKSQEGLEPAPKLVYATRNEETPIVPNDDPSGDNI